MSARGLGHDAREELVPRAPSTRGRHGGRPTRWGRPLDVARGAGRAGAPLCAGVLKDSPPPSPVRRAPRPAGPLDRRLTPAAARRPLQDLFGDGAAAAYAAAAAAGLNSADESLPYSTSELNAPEYSTDDFRMFQFKVARCSKRYVHDWRACPFAHPTENARRRDPRVVQYLPIPCPDYKRGICLRCAPAAAERPPLLQRPPQLPRAPPPPPPPRMCGCRSPAAAAAPRPTVGCRAAATPRRAQGRLLHLLARRVRVLAAPQQVPHAAVQGGALLPPPRLLLRALRARPAPALARVRPAPRRRRRRGGARVRTRVPRGWALAGGRAGRKGAMLPLAVAAADVAEAKRRLLGGAGPVCCCLRRAADACLAVPSMPCRTR